MRKNWNRKDRRQILDKNNGRCAYCGCELTYKTMTLDHVMPLNNGGEDELVNLVAACRSCNHRKNTESIEVFRNSVEKWCDILQRDSTTYRNAVRFGQVIPNPHPCKFYFEKEEDGGNA